MGLYAIFVFAAIGLYHVGTYALNAKPPPYGQLSVRGTKLVGDGGNPVQLIGMSLFWSQWMGQYYTKETVDALACQWGVNAIRVAMGVDQGGYLSNKERELSKVRAVVEAAIERGIYVIVDWHIHEAQNSKQQALDFFKQIANEYGSHPHVLYEPWNEPLEVSWNDVLKPYHQDVLAAIRAIDSDNVVLLGTPSWSGASGITDASNSPLDGQSNVMYVQHFYSGTHRDHERNAYSQAAAKIPVFVSEYGVSEADGGSNGQIYTDEANKWFQLLDQNKASYLAWSVADKNEASAVLKPGTQPGQVGNDERLTAAGLFLMRTIKNKGLFSCDGSAPAPAPEPAPAPAPSEPSGRGDGISVTVTTTNSWPGGAQIAIAVTNNGNSKACRVTLKMQKADDTQIENLWSLESNGEEQYVTPDWANLDVGQTHSAGAIIKGNLQTPSFSIVNTQTC